MYDYKRRARDETDFGTVTRVSGSVVYVKDLPSLKPQEVVVFEDNTIGQVVGIGQELTEVLLFSHNQVQVGHQAIASHQHLRVPVGHHLLGQTLDYSGSPIVFGKDRKQPTIKPKDKSRSLVSHLESILKRKEIDQPLETGITMVDMVTPLAKGQRELVIGDRNTGKTRFLFQTMVTQARQGTVCIYAIIGKKRASIKKLVSLVNEAGIQDRVIIVASSASEPAGRIFITPYTAMTIAEYFKEEGQDSLVIMDDLTNHAKYHREISLLSDKFPGRNSYPGDIFHIHSKLLERAGNFANASISCLPAAESILGDLSGYIQTNLMAMTDGHIFFDIERFNQGLIPSINPFLSVTRVGLQAQIPIIREISRALTRYLVRLERIRQYMHFGAELSESVKKILSLGDRLDAYLSQDLEQIVPANVNAFLMIALWGGFFRADTPEQMKDKMQAIIKKYVSDDVYKAQIDELITEATHIKDLVDKLKLDDQLINIPETVTQPNKMDKL